MVRLVTLLLVVLFHMALLSAQKIDLTKQVKGVLPPDVGGKGCINPKSVPYNAVGDGVAIDTTAIQTAINAASAAKRPLCLTDGTYLIDNVLTIPSDTEIVGEGWGAILKFNWSGQTPAAIYITNSDSTNGNSKIRFQNFSIEGSGTGSPQIGGTLGIHFIKVSDLVILNCRFHRIPAAAVKNRGTKRGRIIGNLVFESGRGGISTTGWSGDFTPAEDVIVSNNTLFRTGDDAISVISTETAATAMTSRTKRVVVSNNTIMGWDSVVSNMTARGIIVLGTEDFSVTGNVIDNTASAGILVGEDIESATNGFNSRYGTVTGNTITAAGAINAGSNPNGILVYGSSHVTLSSNSVRGSVNESLRVGNGTTIPTADITVVGNVFSDTPGSQTPGVLLLGNASSVVERVTVSNNMVSGNHGPGIKIQAAERVILSNNVVINNGNGQVSGTDVNAAGILVRGEGITTSFIAKENRVTDTRGGSAKQTYGIVFPTTAGPVTNAVVENNLFDGNVTAGVRVDQTPTTFKRFNNRQTAADLGVNFDYLKTNAADPADAEAIRLGNNERMAWEAATPGSDFTFGLSAEDAFEHFSPNSFVTFRLKANTASTTDMDVTYTNASGNPQVRWNIVDADSQEMSLDINGNLITAGSMQLGDSGTKPTCDSTQRFRFWVDAGAAGVKDTVEVCAKDAGDAYAWRVIY